VLAGQAVAVLTGHLPTALASTMLAVLGLAYTQNLTYGLQSRAALRNSNAYHALAAFAGNLTFFWSLQVLVRNELPLVLLAPYVFATIVGTLHAKTLSERIEGWLGINSLLGPAPKVEKGKQAKSTVTLKPLLMVLTAALIAQVVFLSPSFGRGTLAALLVLTVLGSFSFSLLRVARSTDHYWYHLGAVLVNLGVGFLSYLIMIRNQYDWALFLSTTTGSIIGSLVGADMGSKVGKKLQAKFDAHVGTGVKVAWPGRQLAFVSLGLAVHLVAYGLAGWKAALTLLAVSAWQAVSFTMVSRARQRDSKQYLAWTSVFSNGVWYLAMQALTAGAIGWDKAAPYIVGNAAGSLVGQTLAMKAEQATGALVDQPAPKPAGAAATA
jgi:hypothetical protein